jgi:cell division septal protein FtsQ
MVADWTSSASARPRLRLPTPSALLPSRRIALLTGAIVVALALAYLAARTTPLFAVRAVEVSGAPASMSEEVKRTAARFTGTSLVALDGTDLIRRIESLPTVVSARYDRAFPHTLRIFVVPERPVAVIVNRRATWVVSERGRVMDSARRRDLQRYPHIDLEAARGLTPGQTIRDPNALEPLGALARIAETFPVRVHAARLDEGKLVFVLAASTELRLGEPVDLDVKLAASARVLRTLSGEERARLAYLDVSLPERPVAAENAQVVG